MMFKKKVSIDFSQQSYALLSDYVAKKDSSNSAIINALCQAILPLSGENLEKLGKFCSEMLAEANSEQRSKTGFEAAEAKKNCDQWATLTKLFPYEEKEDQSERKMRRFQLKDGFCIVPQDYVVLDNIFGAPEDCMYAGVVESRNSLIYGIPHFLFFCNEKYANSYTEEMESAIYEECRKKFPDFTKYYNMQRTPTQEDRNDIEKMREWNKLPYFGLFHIVEEGDPLYWTPFDPNFIPPDGAMIVRSKK